MLYSVRNIIAKGSCSEIHLVQHNSSRTNEVMKIIKLGALYDDDI